MCSVYYVRVCDIYCFLCLWFVMSGVSLSRVCFSRVGYGTVVVF